MEFKGTKRNWSEAEFSDFISFSHPGMALSGCATEETKANGRLAMAAPDLLKVLQLIISYHDDGNCELHSEDVAMARAAISKALGEE